MTLPILISYSLGKGFAFMGGALVNSSQGFAPLTGIRHTFVSKKVLAVTLASFYFNPAKDLQFFGIYEFKPPIGENWILYTRAQILYAHNSIEVEHGRSYLYLRAGLKRNRVSFGLGSNLDRFGPDLRLEENYGVFVRWELK